MVRFVFEFGLWVEMIIVERVYFIYKLVDLIEEYREELV